MNFNQFLLVCVLYKEKLIGTSYSLINEKGNIEEEKKITATDIEIVKKDNSFIMLTALGTDLITYKDCKVYCIFKKENRLDS